MQAIETERSPGLPSLMVTTRRRLMPHGTSFSFLQAVTQALHSMQRSASQRNFMRAMARTFLPPPDLAERNFQVLHCCRRIVSVGAELVHALTEHVRVGAFRIFAALIDALEPAAEMIGHPGHALADAVGHQRLHPCARTVFRP